MAHRPTLASLAATLVAGCSLLPATEPARVSLAELRPLTSPAHEQRYLLRLRIENPGRAPLAVERIVYRVGLGDQDLGSGVSPQPFTVPGRGERVVEVELATDRRRSPDAVRRRDGRRGEDTTFRLTGALELAGAGGDLRFEQDGVLRPGGGDS